MDVYNKNRDKNNGMHDEIKEQNAKLKNASFKEKLSYFKDYYLKATIGVLIGIIFVAALIHDIASGPDDTVFAAYFYNDSGDSSNTELADSFAEYMGIDTSEHDVYIDATASYYTDEEMSENTAAAMSSYEIYTYLQKTMALISTNDLDIIAGNKSAFDYFAKAECLADVTTVLSEEQIEKYQDYFYYYTNEETSETYPAGIYINDAPKIQSYHYYDYSEGILGFVVNSEDLDNATAFLDYIFTE